ncbi:hypothetical protein LCGC14_0820660 [marine sediment metagenome]|uniref:Uncharacterized protein n=1 Tax=marine sediment metagenome TaxID=412755 RepID=A0A0F9Q4A2_9ZZZZ
MREGCPIAPVELRPEPECQEACGYLLEVWPARDMLTVFCHFCGQMRGVDAVTFQDGEKEVSWRLLRLCEWMNDHAGNPKGMAEDALLTDVATNLKATAWARALMAGEVVPAMVAIRVLNSRQYYRLDAIPGVHLGDDAKRLTMLTVSKTERVGAAP